MNQRLPIMKNLLLIILLAITSATMAQSKSSSYIKWEGLSKEGHIIYGISYTKEEAQFVINDFNRRNAKTKFKIVYQTLKKRTTDDKTLVRTFYETYPKKYRVLKKSDMAALHIFQIGTFVKAADFLQKNTGLNELETQKHLQQLLKECKMYRMAQHKI